MELKTNSTAGTMESSDAMVSVEPGNGEIELTITSPVLHQFGNRIRAVVLERLKSLNVDSAVVNVVDKGALDCTLRARVDGAVYRAADASAAGIPWGETKSDD